MSSKYVSLVLSILESGKDAKKETFTQESVTVGAGTTADLKIEGDKVSDIHAMFDASRGSEVFIMDLGSSTGTFVNDKKVNKQKLEIGDQVKLGDVIIDIVDMGDSAEEEKAEEAVVSADESVATEEETQSAEETEVVAEEAEVETEVEAAEDEVEAEEQAEEQVEAAEEVVEAADDVVEEAEAEVEEEVQAAEETVESVEASEPDETDEEIKRIEEARSAKTKEESEKTYENKKAAFEAKKAKARSKDIMYDLEVIPEKHVTPKGAKVFESREVVYNDTMLSVNHHKGEKLTFGQKKSNTFFMSADYLPTETFVVAEPNPSGYVLNFTGQMEGEVIEGGERISFDDLVKSNKATDKGGFFQFALSAHQAMCYRFDEMKYYFHYVEPEKLKLVPFTKKIDYPITSLLVVLFLSYTLMTIYLKSLPAPEVADILDAPDRFAKLILEPIEMEEPEMPEEELNQETPEKAMGEEGKVGKEEEIIDKTEGSARKRLEDEKVANSSGILGALDKGMENMDRLFGGGGLGAGLEKNLGMLEGISGLDMRGAGGLGSRGSGLGGGGTALGIGGLGTKGRGGGRGGGRYGIGASGRLKKRGANINIRTGNPTIAGALDKSIIARIIKKHYSQIRYCYQKELNKNPKLYGKISIKFTISPRGTVSSSVAKVSTMKNFQVEQCVAKTIKRIIFPRPKGGGIVVVTYPFIFKAEGS